MARQPRMHHEPVLVHQSELRQRQLDLHACDEQAERPVVSNSDSALEFRAHEPVEADAGLRSLQSQPCTAQRLAPVRSWADQEEVVINLSHKR